MRRSCKGSKVEGKVTRTYVRCLCQFHLKTTCLLHTSEVLKFCGQNHNSICLGLDYIIRAGLIDQCMNSPPLGLPNQQAAVQQGGARLQEQGEEVLQ